MEGVQSETSDTKKIFMTKGSCSQALCYLVNRDFAHQDPDHERAMDPFAGGLLLSGHQCGMVWGSSMAAGIQAWILYHERGQAISAAITASSELVKSYTARSGAINCRDVCGHDLNRKIDLFLFMVKFILHINRACLHLADAWTPEACRTVHRSLSDTPVGPANAESCASRTVKAMGATEQEEAIVSGFAGGIGLSGNACGALGAAVWMRTLAWTREKPGKSSYNNPYARKVLKNFMEATGSKVLCRDVCGRTFHSIEEHSDFVRNGGCAKIIAALSKA